MKKITSLLITCLFFAVGTYAQPTTAKDFIMNDCNGNMHHLYSELDSNYVVILEFFMLNCSSCIVAGQQLNDMHARLNAEFAGKIRYYAFGYQNSYSCSNISNWINNNGFNAIPFDSGASQVAYYGGMGMPTIVVAAGAQHEVLYIANFDNHSYSAEDTATISASVRSFFTSTGLQSEIKDNAASINLFPNPTAEDFQLEFQVSKNSEVKIRINNLLGKKIEEMSYNNLSLGQQKLTINTSSFNSGIYVLQMDVNGTTLTKKFSIVK